MKVTFCGVEVQLGGRQILHSIDLTVESGRFLGLVGPNGSGKSTLLRTVYRAIRPNAGSVRLGELDVWQSGRRDVARTVAVMTQESSTEFDFTALEVVLLGRVPFQRGFGRDSAEDRALAWEALEAVRATDLAHHPVGALSGGQKQRVQLARALAADSEIVLLDEPTNHLDIAFQLELMRITTSLNRTVIAALHDLNLAATYCDDLAVLDAGRLVAAGKPHAVLSADLVRRVFAVDVDRLTHPLSGRPVLAFGHPDLTQNSQ